MQIANSRFHKVWEVKKENGFTKINLSDSKKNQDGTYNNWTWFDCLLVGGAKNKQISKDDKITIISGLVNKRKYNDKYYDEVVIFDFEVTESAGNVDLTNSSLDEFAEYDDPNSDVPF